jgi:hypothetical protein
MIPGASHGRFDRIEPHMDSADLRAKAASERGLAHARKSRQDDERRVSTSGLSSPFTVGVASEAA